MASIWQKKGRMGARDASPGRPIEGLRQVGMEIRTPSSFAGVVDVQLIA
ncbi:MAG TPA: hypothetical protein VMZ52_17655 [Bryobacteraceae bacterium]|nr:hypothetical protein [Bryobacteraceae bacterium]